MRKRQKGSSESSSASGNEATDSSFSGQEGSQGVVRVPSANRSSYTMLTIIGLLIYSSWSVYHYQYEVLPVSLTAKQAGKRGFSEAEAMKHVKALAGLGPHPVGSDSLDRAIQYVVAAAEMIKNTSHWEVDVEVDQFHVKSGANLLRGGFFAGRTGVYADLNHVILRITPKYLSEARDNSILVSSHIDTVFTTGGAGDCSSCVAVMLELARGVSQWAHGFKSSVVFLFNIGEEEGLNGAHSFVDQHPWSETVRVAVDLETMGIGGKSSIFQAGPDPWAIENFAMVAKYPSGNIMAQDLFASGVIKSATDFQVYKEAAGLSGLDFAYTDNTAVYHTKNDKVELLTPGSLQHLGENMLAFLLRGASLPALANSKDSGVEHDSSIYFDILGTYMIVYRRKFANMLHNSVIVQSILIWIVSLLMGGYPAIVSLALSSLSVILMWAISISFSVLVAFMLPLISLSAIPYISSPWMVIGLFGIPSLLGALVGQHLGFLLLQKYLSHTYVKRRQNLSPSSHVALAKLEAERWLFKSGSIQWLLILIIANYYKVGSSFIPLFWLVTPAFSYGLLEATLIPARLPKPLKFVTLLVALSVPILVSAGGIIRIVGVLIGTIIRIDRNPGGVPEWLGNVAVAVVVAAVVCLMLVYLLSYVHLSGAKRPIILVSCVLFGVSLAAVWSGVIPPYTEDTARAVNVVHVVDTTGSHAKEENLTSYVSLFSSTPGKFTKEIEQIEEGFKCGRDNVIDFVTFSVKYGCVTYDETEIGWSHSDIPIIHVDSDEMTDKRVTHVTVNTKVSKRWSLKINMKEIADFEFRVSGECEELIPVGDKSSINGWHIIQFSGGKNAPTKFDITLIWAENSTRFSREEKSEKYLLKLRTDIDRLTPKAGRVLKKLPSWFSLFGKSTSPYTLAFLGALPIEF